MYMFVSFAPEGMNWPYGMAYLNSYLNWLVLGGREEPELSEESWVAQGTSQNRDFLKENRI